MILIYMHDYKMILAMRMQEKHRKFSIKKRDFMRIIHAILYIFTLQTFQVEFYKNYSLYSKQLTLSILNY